VDVVASGIVQNETKIIFMKNHGGNSFGVTQTLSTGYQTATFFLADVDQDGKIDVIVSGENNGAKSTKAFFNNGSFNFPRTSTPFANQAFTDFIFADLNNDGVGDLVACDNGNLFLFQQKNGQFVLRKDSALLISSISVFDLDNNGFPDIAFSGSSESKPTTGVLFLKDNFKILKKSHVYSINGTLASGDIDHDGLFDLLVSGNDSTGALVLNSFANQGNSFKSVKRTPGFDPTSIMIADFTSDGKTDAAIFVNSNTGNKAWIKTFNGDSIVIECANVRSQAFGDYDDDGDLDMMQLRDDSVTIFNNNLNVINQGPSIVVSSLGVQLYDRMFFYWARSADDHTGNSLTYDLAVYDGAGATKSADFDRANLHRLIVAHGNTGVVNYSIQKLSGNLSYQIQSIDNSFAIQTKLVGGGGSSSCADVAMENTVCAPNDKVQLKPQAPQAMWFSFKNGFLGVHDSLSYSRSESDTIFSFNPNNLSCASIKLFPIRASSDTIKLTQNIWNCENSQNVLTIPTEWSSVTWKSNLSSTISSGNQQTATLTSPITYTAIGSNDLGCKLKEVFNLKVSKPDLKVANNQYQIAEGSSVQLIASGGNSYSWLPADGLSDPTVSSPVASPLNTTKYTVTAKDSLDCKASADVLVEVMEAGFIPTLFTPNGDGKNDAIKIFGLTSASNFRFTIYNREGSIMFDTKDISTAVYQGWSGSTNGHSQPSGTYYWKVQGDNHLGGEITLNGKKSGAFLLVR
jgi:gliding motility-associated-like protein